ncbi:MAG: histidine phosphatase family protein [Rickettsiales bacterium]|jgi:phosphohistidine phosphatase|nr:histidine phosphatase family protein [Rickettsiales bacterium]
MKNIFLLRHAHAAISNTDDFNRNLSNKGVLKCQDIANTLKKYIQDIDLILCSSSLRTRQTIETTLLNLNLIKTIQYENELYNASLNSFFQRIISITPKNKNILIISHNPTISEAGKFLAKDSSSSPHYLEVLQGFSPGSLALYETNIASWKTLDPSNISLKEFWR